MKEFICNFAPIRFLPYRETGEFVNVGVVVHCPQLDFFDFRVVTRKTRRITGFFPELEVDVLKKALRGLQHELETLPMTATELERVSNVSPKISEYLIARFRELVRAREGLLHFGPMGTCLIDKHETAVDDLFSHYVERQFAQGPEYQEKVMRVRLYQFLKDWNVSRFYKKNEIIGDDEFHVNMPFVHYSNARVERVIKPINLSQDTASEIIDHGGTWVSRMQRLKKKGQLPRTVIFPVKLPNEGKQLSAAREICHEMEAVGILPLAFSDKSDDIAALHKIAVEGLSDTAA